MSAKSRKKETGDRSPTNVLFRQKQIMKSAYREYLAITVFCCILILITTILIVSPSPHEKEPPIGVVCGIAGFVGLTGVFGFWFMQSYLIFKGIDRIRSAGEETVTVRCKKISFITEIIPRIVSRDCQNIVCIVLTDQTENKYYYITGRYSDYTLTAATEKIKKDFLNANLSLRCYTGTNYVKFNPEIIKELL
jgi:hypothetical protein